MTEQPHEFDPLVDQLPSRYVVGIDLGTTNSAVTYVDTGDDPWQVRVFPVPQLVAPGQVEARQTLPSFHYQAAQGELDQGALRLPWSHSDPTYAVGCFGRDQGTKTPGRLIASAKSWLCHTGVDRTADLLPWHGAADVDRLSPVEVSARYLRHVREAWDTQFPHEPLSRQEIVLTLPASFDEVARELTVQAAAQADLPRVVLIEEPQAAFYAWVYKHSGDWHQQVRPGQSILVCDIGGGTSDFTLIRARRSDAVEAENAIQFHRVAVGDHLILGGDNLDLALARHVEQQLAGDGQLQPRQWDVLVRSCRHVKETLLGDEAPEQLTINLPGSGSRLIGGGLQAEVTREQVRQLLVDGFLPGCGLHENPTRRQSGFQEFGLPYAADAAITRYLAAFLTAHQHAGVEEPAQTSDASADARPDVVLFNGGFFASSLLRERLLEVLTSWFRTPPRADWSPHVLDNDRLDLAVARGAAYYGMVRRGEGVRITANLARSYYISVESDEPAAVCLLPGHAEPGQSVDLTERTFDLLVSQPVEFPLYVSSTRLTDRPGDLVQIDPERMSSLPPIRTVLRTQRRSEVASVPVNLHARLTEIGTIDLWCSQTDTDRRWKLQFDVRSTTQTDVMAHDGPAEAEGVVDEETWQQCQDLISGVFLPTGGDQPEGLVKRLAKVLQSSRHQWPTSLLRRMWESLMEMAAGRRRSRVHEARWLNLLGYALRPGYGLALDDWRVAETWRAVQGKLVHPCPTGRTESLILWRRLAGGLSAGQQRAIAEPLLGPVRGLHRKLTTGKSRASDVALNPHESSEVWRLLGSLELMSVPWKVELGDMLIDLLPKRKLANVRGPMVWALARLGQRVPVYGPLNLVVPPDQAAAWLAAVLEQDGRDPMNQLAAMQLTRRTDDRYRDLSAESRQEVIDWLTGYAAPAHLVQLVRERGKLDTEEQGQIFGEAFPKGLRIQ